MPKKIDESEGKKLATQIVKEVLENGLTLMQASKKNYTSNATARRYVELFVTDKNLLEKFNETLHYNKIHHPGVERKEPEVNYTAGKIEVEQLRQFYNTFSECDTPYHAIMEGKRAAKTTEEIARKEYLKWRHEWVRRRNYIINEKKERT